MFRFLIWLFIEFPISFAVLIFSLTVSFVISIFSLILSMVSFFKKRKSKTSHKASCDSNPAPVEEENAELDEYEQARQESLEMCDIIFNSFQDIDMDELAREIEDEYQSGILSEEDKESIMASIDRTISESNGLIRAINFLVEARATDYWFLDTDEEKARCDQHLEKLEKIRDLCYKAKHKFLLDSTAQ